MSLIKEYSNTQLQGPTPTKGEWNIYGINPYIDAFSPNFEDNGFCTGMVTCPSCSGDFMMKEVHWHWENETNFCEVAYSYWVIGGLEPPLEPDSVCADAYRDLTIDMLSSKRLLMTEILAIDDWGGGSGYPLRYNHGKRGWSWFDPDFVHITYDPESDATGRSRNAR
jgi:hypothetical protein